MATKPTAKGKLKAKLGAAKAKRRAAKAKTAARDAGRIVEEFNRETGADTSVVVEKKR